MIISSILHNVETEAQRFYRRCPKPQSSEVGWASSLGLSDSRVLLFIASLPHRGDKNAADAQGSTTDIFLESKKYKRKDIPIVPTHSYLLEKI